MKENKREACPVYSHQRESENNGGQIQKLQCVGTNGGAKENAV